ncbi:unnamed protein product [Ectocarpus sp. 12 AP-2014]
MGIIKDVRAVTVSVPLDNPTSFSNRQVLKRDYSLVEITSDTGHKGIGFCYGGSNAGGLVTKAVRELLRPLLLGQETYQVEGLWQKMYQEALLHGRAGSVMRAISIIDTALWDHNARAVDLPLYKLLGAHASDSVPAYASGGYYLEGKQPEDLADEMQPWHLCAWPSPMILTGLRSPLALMISITIAAWLSARQCQSLRVRSRQDAGASRICWIKRPP